MFYLIKAQASFGPKTKPEPQPALDLSLAQI